MGGARCTPVPACNFPHIHPQTTHTPQASSRADCTSIPPHYPPHPQPPTHSENTPRPRQRKHTKAPPPKTRLRRALARLAQRQVLAVLQPRVELLPHLRILLPAGAGTRRVMPLSMLHPQHAAVAHGRRVVGLSSMDQCLARHCSLHNGCWVHGSAYPSPHSAPGRHSPTGRGPAWDPGARLQPRPPSSPKITNTVSHTSQGSGAHKRASPEKSPTGCHQQTPAGSWGPAAPGPPARCARRPARTPPAPSTKGGARTGFGVGWWGGWGGGVQGLGGSG